MKDRSKEDFSNVMANLRLTNPDIVPVPKKFTNSVGVYHNPNGKEGFQYVAAFVTTDEDGSKWVETFGVEKDGTKMVISGRYESVCLAGDTPSPQIRDKATEQIERYLRAA